MSHVTKLILRIILRRIQGRTAGEVSEEQCGFVKDKGTRNATFILRTLMERATQDQKDLYIRGVPNKSPQKHTMERDRGFILSQIKEQL